MNKMRLPLFKTRKREPLDFAQIVGSCTDDGREAGASWDNVNLADGSHRGVQELENICNEEFWHELRKQTVVHGSIGSGLCYDWAREAKELLEKGGICAYIVKRAGLPILTKTGLAYHAWLELDVSGRYFIADGTAGQIDKDLPLGFYGFLEQIPNSLVNVYLYVETETPHKELDIESISALHSQRLIETIGLNEAVEKLLKNAFMTKKYGRCY
jgi:hypothetical protein